MKTKYFFLSVFLLLITSCKAKKSISDQKEIKKTENIEKLSFSADDLLNRVKYLSLDSLEGRETGTKGGIMARDYVVSQFEKLNIQPLSSDFKQLFTFKSRSKTFEAANVLGLIKGNENPEKYIVISAHYDHVGIHDGEIYNGADDDASGTSALFAFAEYFKKYPPKHSVILAAFDAEELGLQGAKHFVESNTIPKEQIVLNINLDMVGRNDNNELYAVGTNIYKKLKPLVENIDLPENFKLLTGHDGFDGKQNWTFSSDHGPFHRAKIPFIYFGVEDHEDYHKPTDDFEKIQPQFYINAVTAIISVFEKADNMKL